MNDRTPARTPAKRAPSGKDSFYFKSLKSLVADAVGCERVSATNSLLAGKSAGNFKKSPRGMTEKPANHTKIQMVCRVISLLRRAGNLQNVTGNSAADQGELEPLEGVVKTSDPVMLRRYATARRQSLACHREQISASLCRSVSRHSRSTITCGRFARR